MFGPSFPIAMFAVFIHNGANHLLAFLFRLMAAETTNLLNLILFYFNLGSFNLNDSGFKLNADF